MDYTVPFGAFGGVGAVGFTVTGPSFTPAAAGLVDQIEAAGRRSYSPIQVTTAPIETIFCAPDLSLLPCGASSPLRTLRYDIAVAALDQTNNRRTDYDTLVFFDANAGVRPGLLPFPPLGRHMLAPAGGRRGSSSRTRAVR